MEMGAVRRGWAQHWLGDEWSLGAGTEVALEALLTSRFHQMLEFHRN